MLAQGSEFNFHDRRSLMITLAGRSSHQRSFIRDSDSKNY